MLIAHVKAVRGVRDRQMILTLSFTRSPPCTLPLALPAVAQEGLSPRFRVQSISAAHSVGAAKHTIREHLVMQEVHRGLLRHTVVVLQTQVLVSGTLCKGLFGLKGNFNGSCQSIGLGRLRISNQN